MKPEKFLLMNEIERIHFLYTGSSQYEVLTRRIPADTFDDYERLSTGLRNLRAYDEFSPRDQEAYPNILAFH